MLVTEVDLERELWPWLGDSAHRGSGARGRRRWNSRAWAFCRVRRDMRGDPPWPPLRKGGTGAHQITGRIPGPLDAVTARGRLSLDGSTIKTASANSRPRKSSDQPPAGTTIPG